MFRVRVDHHWPLWGIFALSIKNHHVPSLRYIEDERDEFGAKASDMKRAASEWFLAIEPVTVELSVNVIEINPVEAEFGRAFVRMAREHRIYRIAVGLSHLTIAEGI